jgi:hypothetical protein
LRRRFAPLGGFEEYLDDSRRLSRGSTLTETRPTSHLHSQILDCFVNPPLLCLRLLLCSVLLCLCLLCHRSALCFAARVFGYTCPTPLSTVLICIQTKSPSEELWKQKTRITFVSLDSAVCSLFRD